MRKQTHLGSNPRFLTCLFVTLMVFTSRALAKGPLQGGRRVTAGESSNLVPPKLKGYRNANYNFLLKYPANWSSYQGFDGNGVSLYPPSSRGRDGDCSPHGPGRARLTHPVLIAGKMRTDRGSHEHPL
jgi:hypothetical protein